jgi:hypothetical protein
MISRNSRWLLMLALAAAIVGGSWFGRGWLAGQVRDRLAEQYSERLRALPEAAAAQLIRELALHPEEWLGLIVNATGDSSPVIAAAAEAELLTIVEQWSALPPEQSSARAGKLARLLADQAPRLPADRRDVSQAIAQRLLNWPIDGRHVDAAKLIADCQQVLLLPRSEPAEIRVADASARPAGSATTAPAAPMEPPAPIESAVPTASVATASPPELPAALPADGAAARQEPGRFTAPRGIRIFHDE